MEPGYFRALEFTLKWEGGYVDHPDDPGGVTNKGITQTVYDVYLKTNGRPLKSVKNIADNELRDIYYRNYWLPSGANQLPSPLSVVVFDTSVNFGVSWAVKLLQRLLGAQEDGVIGRYTLAAVQKNDPRVLSRGMVLVRRGFRFERVQANSSQKAFLKGWISRDESLFKYIS